MGQTCSPGETWQHLEIFLAATLGGVGRAPGTDDGRGRVCGPSAPGSPEDRDYLAYNGNSTTSEKPCVNCSYWVILPVFKGSVVQRRALSPDSTGDNRNHSQPGDAKLKRIPSPDPRWIYQS